MSKLKREKLAELTIPELKELLQNQGLSTSGNKDTLIDRLLTVNPAGPGVMVVETVSMSKRKKDAAAPQPPLTELATLSGSSEPATQEKQDDAAALIAQLKELVAQAQSAVIAAQQAQQAAEAAALSHKKGKGAKKEKKNKKKKEKITE